MQHAGFENIPQLLIALGTFSGGANQASNRIATCLVFHLGRFSLLRSLSSWCTLQSPRKERRPWTASRVLKCTGAIAVAAKVIVVAIVAGCPPVLNWQ